MSARRLTRRDALRAGVAAFVAAQAVPELVHADSTQPTFVLDPTRGGQCGPSGCNNCNACRTHALNKLFSTSQAADRARAPGAYAGGRAHIGCRCAVISGPPLRTALFRQVFANSDWADRRDPTTQAQLSALLSQNSAPFITGAGPIAVVVAGAAGLVVLASRRPQEPAPET